MRVTPELNTACWRRSSYSGGEQGDACVEVCDAVPGTIPVRDSKNPTGPVLLLGTAAWRPFVNGVTDGNL
ncbi:DUF397 domain-containing protein [Streptomyces sp. L2]|uniref:DUF397 domain-containing protein n=1 Tax=Streptomyces sp. L2 TaxID=2162665 RepID=UPI001013A181|nr:DUF397 domain-containing protein [Streptomyces sp. L2]